MSTKQQNTYLHVSTNTFSTDFDVTNYNQQN